MTGSEMLYEFRLGFDVIASNLAPGFEDDEIYKLLNRGYDKLILDLHLNRDWVSLNTLVKKGLDITPGIENGIKYISLPSDFWLYCDSYSKVTKSVTDPTSGFIQTIAQTSEFIDNDLINFTDSTAFLETAYNKHRLYKKPKAYLMNGRLYVLPDFFTTINTVTFMYVKKRLDISDSQDCELQQSFHREVVNLAIDIAKDVINKQVPQSSK